MKNDFFKYILLSSNSRQNRTELETETLPYTFYTQPKTLKNYRIYGNTEEISGESVSVGDKTTNILPLSRTPITETHGDFLCEYDGFGSIILTTDKDNAKTDGLFIIPLMRDFTIPASIGQGGTGCLQINNNFHTENREAAALLFVHDEEIIDSWRLLEINRTNSIYTGMSYQTINKIAIRIEDSETFRCITLKPAFVENTTQQVPFEPYGYKIPVVVNEQTTNIYLNEPLAKSGNNADYIDYKTQKRYNTDGTIESTTLPKIAVYDSENEISIDTTVQPSKVYLQGEISEAEIVSAETVQANIQNLQPLSLDENAEFDVISDNLETTGNDEK